MTSEELTQIVTVHQQALVRHEQEMAEIRDLVRLNQEQYGSTQEQFKSLQEEFRLSREQFRERYEFTQEQLNQMTAGLVELRHLVADYIQGRSRD